jgi:glutamate racemase
MFPLSNQSPIGVFDSGVGGLTVYRALKQALPAENFIYLGDTARLPYGTKSADTVASYGLQATRFLLRDNIKLLVVACNTASAQALPSLQHLVPEIPILGVIEPGAAAAVKDSRSGRIAVLATEGTARSGAYVDAIKTLNPSADVHVLACNLLVALAEEGWCEGAEADAIVQRYLHALPPDYDTLVLGCTHFPLLATTLRKHLRPNVTLIDSASAVAEAVKDYMQQYQLMTPPNTSGTTRFYVTDAPERFCGLAKRFLNEDIAAQVQSAYLDPVALDAPTSPKSAKAS